MTNQTNPVLKVCEKLQGSEKYFLHSRLIEHTCLFVERPNDHGHLHPVKKCGAEVFA